MPVRKKPIPATQSLQPGTNVTEDSDQNHNLRRSARLATSTSLPKIEDNSDESPPPKKAKRIRKKAKHHNDDEDDTEFTEKPSKPLYKLSSNIFPNLDAPGFYLAQERLADEPFKVLVACIFLTRTKGTVSMPVCRELFRQYPSPEDIAHADIKHITSMLQPLGLHNRRAKTIINLASAWVAQPPARDKRYRKLHYPVHGDGSDIAPSEQPINDEKDDPRTAWEIAHLPGVGAYALDSWRIFCRDTLRNIRNGLLDVNSAEDVADERQQEWTRVVPLDKELIAYIRWRWLRLGYLWNPVDGTKIKVDSDIVTRLRRRELTSYKGFGNPWVEYTNRVEDEVE